MTARPWTEAECQFLVDHYPKRPVADMARTLNRSYYAVVRRLFLLRSQGRVGGCRPRRGKVKNPTSRQLSDWRYYDQHRECVMARIKRRKHLSAILHRVKADQFANREKNAKRARQVDIEDGRARMGSFVPHHIKFRDPND